MIYERGGDEPRGLTAQRPGALPLNTYHQPIVLPCPVYYTRTASSTSPNLASEETSPGVWPLSALVLPLNTYHQPTVLPCPVYYTRPMSSTSIKRNHDDVGPEPFCGLGDPFFKEKLKREFATRKDRLMKETEEQMLAK